MVTFIDGGSSHVVEDKGHIEVVDVLEDSVKVLVVGKGDALEGWCCSSDRIKYAHHSASQAPGRRSS